MIILRACRDEERPVILEIINAAAVPYKGAIPADCWHEPYMLLHELERDIAAGVAFWGCEVDGALMGVMGIQTVLDVDLIRHAYVRPACQRQGMGGQLLNHLRASSDRRMLIGTWAAAPWAISFYRARGFALVPGERKIPLLKTYWTVPDRQIEASVVLADPPFDGN